MNSCDSVSRPRRAVSTVGVGWKVMSLVRDRVRVVGSGVGSEVGIVSRGVN